MLLLFTVLIDLRLELTDEFLDLRLQLLHLRLLEVEIFTLVRLREVLIDKLWPTRENGCFQFLEGRFSEWHLLAAIALLLLELHGLSSSTRSAATTSSRWHTHVVHETSDGLSGLVVLLWHWRGSFKLVMDSLNDSSKA